MNRRWNLLFLLPLALAVGGFALFNDAVYAWGGLAIGVIILYLLRPLALPPHLHGAVRFYRNGQLEQALAKANAAIDAHDDRWESFHTRSLIHFALSNLTAAADDARRAIALNPDAYVGQAALGQALYALGRYEEAETAYRRAVALSRKDGPSRYYLALTLYRLGAYEAVVETMPEALALGIDNPSLNLMGHFVLGRSLAAINQPEAAHKAYAAMGGYAHGLTPLEADLAQVAPYPALAELKADVAAMSAKLSEMSATPA